MTLESGVLPKRQSALAHIADKLFLTWEKQFTRQLSHRYQPGSFDAILCSTYYYFPLLTALRLSRKWHIPFYADLRDIAEQWGTMDYFTTKLPRLGGLEKVAGKLYERRFIRLRNRILRQASAVTTVSPWHRDWLQRFTPSPVTCIYNGYDEREFAPENRKTNLFRVSFFGRIISLSLRQPHLLLQAAGELLREGQIDADNFSLDFYCEPELRSSLEALAQQYGAAECLHCGAYFPRTELREHLAESSVLVALGAAAGNGQHGILGTKIFEAIGMEKPFVLVPSDQDSMAELIAQTGIGIAAEDTAQLKSFLLDQYATWQKQGFTRQPVTHKEIFSRRYQARQMEEIIEN